MNADLRQFPSDQIVSRSHAAEHFTEISHELRCALTLVLTPLEDALTDGEAGLPPRQRERLELARRGSLRLRKLVNGLLELARVDAGPRHVLFEPVALDQLTLQFAESFRSVCERAGLELDVSCEAPTAPVYVCVEMWETIVSNLLSNAIKYTFHGGISVSLHPVGEGMELRVSDTGLGIPDAALPCIFERFYRAPGIRGRTHEGSGIGLALVRELVALHGGSAAVASHAGHGSTFTVSLPVGRAHLPQQNIAASRVQVQGVGATAAFVDEVMNWLGERSARVPAYQPDDSGGLSEVNPARVLIVARSSELRERIQQTLATRYEVQCADDSASACATIRTARPDLVLIDGALVSAEGLDAMNTLRGQLEAVAARSLLLSAQSDPCWVNDKCEDVLAQPFTPQQLLTRVETHLLLACAERSVADPALGLPQHIASLSARIERVLALLDPQSVPGAATSLTSPAQSRATPEATGEDRPTQAVSSEPETGVAGRPDAESSAAPSTATQGATQQVKSPSLRVLVADDNEDAATSLAMIVELMGNDVRVAHDGEAALQLAESFRPDIMLLDVGMPRMTGHEVARHIRATSWGANVALVAVTGWGQESDKRRSRDAGFNLHLVKPLDPDMLQKVLTKDCLDLS